MRLVGGGRFYPHAPRSSHFRIESTAAGIAKEGRYGGQMPGFCSVAEHSLLVASILPPEIKLQGLLHDASEAWLRDQTRPVKALLPDYRSLEGEVQPFIFESFGLPAEMDPRVKIADDAVWVAEEIQIFGKDPRDFLMHPPAAKVTVQCLEWREAEAAFLAMFHQLTNGAYQ